MTRRQEDVVRTRLRRAGVRARADELVGRDGTVAVEVGVHGADAGVRRVDLAAPDRIRGARNRDRKGGNEQYDSSHVQLPLGGERRVRRRCESTPGLDATQCSPQRARTYAATPTAVISAAPRTAPRSSASVAYAATATGRGGRGGGVRGWTTRSRGGSTVGAAGLGSTSKSASGSSGGSSASARSRSSGQTSASSGVIGWATARPMLLLSASARPNLEPGPCAKEKRPLSVAAENGRRSAGGSEGGSPAVLCSWRLSARACPRRGISAPDRAIPCPSRRSGRVAEGGALLRRYVGINLRRGFESLLLRSRSSPAPLRPGGAGAPRYAVRRSERWQSGRMRRSRKPLRVVRLVEGSNPSLSAALAGFRCRMRNPAASHAPPGGIPRGAIDRSRRPCAGPHWPVAGPHPVLG